MAAEIISSPYPDVEIPDVPLHQFVLANAGRMAEEPALIDGPSGRTLTFGQLAGGVQRVAAGLAARGFGKGDVLAIYSPNLPEYALAFYGTAAAGGAATTINPLYTVDELAFQLQDAGARFLVTVPPFLDRAREAAARTGVDEVFVFGEAEGATPFASLLAAGGQPSAVAIDPANDLVALPYSSGTTGLPKGVMLTHRNLVANLCQFQDALGTGTGERLIAVLPFFHIYGLVVLMAAAVREGSTLVTMPRFDLEEFLRILQEHHVTRAYLVPPIVLALAKHPMVDKYDLSALQVVVSGAAPLDAGLQGAAASRVDCMVAQGWGLTETSPVLTTSVGAPLGPKPGAVGVLLPNTALRVVDPATGADVGRGETGAAGARPPGHEGLPERAAGDRRHARPGRLAAHRRPGPGRRRRLRLRGRPGQGADQVQGDAGGARRAGGGPARPPGDRRRRRGPQPRRGGRRGPQGVRGGQDAVAGRGGHRIRGRTGRAAQADPPGRIHRRDPQGAVRQDPPPGPDGPGPDGQSLRATQPGSHRLRIST
jgi:acyl-CoA synthetase (AMP-forming)/AMP-acid ligase II